MAASQTEIVDPTSLPGWDGMVESHRGGTVFHSSAWARLLAETYGYTPRFVLSRIKGKIAALIPAMDVRSPLTGKRGVALPFSDYADALYNGKEELRTVWERTIEEGKKRGWKSIELRCREELPEGFSNPATYLHHEVDLQRSEEDIFGSLRESTGRNILKAQQAGIKVEMKATAGGVEDFYRLNCLTRRDHGLPPQPPVFFRNLFDRFISRGKGLVATACAGGKAVAANIFLFFGGQAWYKYGASNSEARKTSAASLLMWEAIRHLAREGFGTLCLGRTEPEDEGLRQFKRGWGSREKELFYYRFDMAKRNFSSNRPAVTGWHNSLFRRLPIPATRFVGTVLYRHFG